jgi:hypothetical protein
MLTLRESIQSILEVSMAGVAAIVSTVVAGASAIDQRQQAKKAASSAKKEARSAAEEAEAARKGEISKGMREAQMKAKSQRAYAAGTQSLLTGSGVSSAGLMG